MSWTWASLRVDWLHQTPFSSSNTVSMKIVYSIVSIISAENVDAPIVHNCCMPVPRRRRLRSTLWNNLDPIICLETESEEIVSPISAVVSAKNVKVVF
jgi:hypothetical protein